MLRRHAAPLFALLLCLLGADGHAAAPATTTLHVDCEAAGTRDGVGTADAPFRSVHQAQVALRALRRTAAAEVAAVVKIQGVCELATTLTLGPADSNTRYVGAGAGAMLSAGTRIKVPTERLGASSGSAAAAAGAVEVDLTQYNFTTDSLGKLSGRGYSGGSACILTANYEPSAAELFYRPDGAGSAAGARAYGPAQEGTMWVARSPNRASGGLPAAADWAGITTVDNLTLTIDAFESQLPAWSAELAAGGEMFMHGLWAWNWADSHRPLLSISGSNITVGADDINRDVSPIHVHKPAMQGGYVYAYGLKSQLDAPGEFHIDAKTAKLSFVPPEGASGGSYSVSRLNSVVTAKGASDITFEGLEIRYARGPGVKIDDSKNVVLKSCTVSNHGMMGVNVTGGSGCGVHASEVAGNGDAGVVLSGGDRQTLTPSKHFVVNSTVHHNHRWIMMFSPDVLLAGVGQSVTDSEIYGSPHFAVFYQGNDHTMDGCHVHDAGRQCSDCAAFYSGRSWTYRGSSILNTKFSSMNSIFPKAHGMPAAVYFDDQLSSVKVSGCVFEQIGGRVMLLGGGRHNEFVGNLLIQSEPTQVIGMDARGGLGSKCVDKGPSTLTIGLDSVPYNTSAVWKSAYPSLANILNDEPCTPK
jgi:hypothetical protein